MQWHKNQPQRDANLIEKYVNWMQRVVKSPQQDAKQEEKWCPQRDTKWLQEAKQSWKETTKEMQNDQQKKTDSDTKLTQSQVVFEICLLEGLRGCFTCLCPKAAVSQSVHDDDTTIQHFWLYCLCSKTLNTLTCCLAAVWSFTWLNLRRLRGSVRTGHIVEVLVKPSGPLLSSWPLHSSHISHRSRLPGRPRGFTHRQTDSTSCAQSCWGTASWQRCMWGLFSLGNVSC